MSIEINREKEILFEAKDMCKSFGSTIALNHVDLTVYRGEIRGLIGENGSGKSTISSIAAGMQQATSGEMFFKGIPHKPTTMVEGAKLGFGMIVQEMGTVSGISIAQNIFLGNEARFRKYGLIDRKGMIREAKKALNRIGFDVDPSAPIDSLDMQERKLVEIAKVMYNNPEVLVVDETTTALSQTGRNIIYQLMKEMKEDGKAVLFISHDLQELIDICDTLTVLRDGKLITTIEKDDMNESKIKRHMVGREIGDHYYREDYGKKISEEIVLKVRNLTTGYGLLKNFNLDLHKGEIVGIGGLSHCGMHELGKAIFGDEKVVYGEVVHVETGDKITNTQSAMKHGLGYVSKNRDKEALVLNASIRDNIIAAGFDKVRNTFGLITSKSEKKYVKEQVTSLSIKCASMEQNVQYLSGGNKQKVVFGKWVGRDSKILILDCPTRGVDIGVKAAMYKLMQDMTKEGKSIIMISEEMTELIGMSDRIIILKDGIASGSFDRSEDLSESNIIEIMI